MSNQITHKPIGKIWWTAIRASGRGGALAGIGSLLAWLLASLPEPQNTQTE